ncbi:MAG TPA: hypothetical protein VGD84_08700, partial [Pseudonocardiaceae bacterium]
LSRWGDYSSMTVDPTDDCTFWYTNQYIPSNGTFNWKTRVGTFKFTNCGGPPPPNDFSISANPTAVSVQQGGSGTTTISTALVSGSAETINLSAGVAPTGPTATFNPTSVQTGGSSTMTVAVPSSTATGSYTITVTGAGTATHSTTVALTVTAPVANDFSISANPSAISLQQGMSGTSAISTALVSGTAQTISLTAAGAPSGTTATLNPTTVTTGGSSTLTLTVGSSTATGPYTITVTGSASSTHSTTVSLTVTAAPPPGAIVNGGFETGTLSGWTAAGTAAVVSGGHSGTYAARVGGTSPTGGDSSIVQTFTAPAAGGGLSLWYKVVCPDTVTYDWATATLKDNTANTTATMLGKTCSNSGAWVQSSVSSLTGSHSYTITLTSHDDNYAGDPTYTVFDDVAIGAGSPPPPPPPTGITNGGFETGSLSGWTSAGTTAAVTGGHSGTYAARVGGTSPTSGDSSVAQTFTAPTGSTGLSFWYKVTCPDTVTYDWATATLRDNTSSTISTVLAKTCTNSGAWVQVTAAVTAGHSYTLTLISHDDNYAGDPTYTLYDDVSTG